MGPICIVIFSFPSHKLMLFVFGGSTGHHSLAGKLRVTSIQCHLSLLVYIQEDYQHLGKGEMTQPRTRNAKTAIHRNEAPIFSCEPTTAKQHNHLHPHFSSPFFLYSSPSISSLSYFITKSIRSPAFFGSARTESGRGKQGPF